MSSALLWGLALAGGPSFAQGIEAPSGIPVAEGTQEEVTIEDMQRVVWHVIDRGNRVRSYDNIEGFLGTHWFVQAVLRDEPADLRVLIYEDVRRLEVLSERTRGGLREGLDLGELIVCAHGLGRDIRAALDLLEPELAEEGTSTGGDGQLVCIHRSPAGHLAELTIAAPESGDEDALSDTINPILEWRAGAAAVGAQSSDPWNAIHLWEWSGPTFGDFGGTQRAGSHRYTLVAYSLATSSQGSDWYRLDFQTISTITNYEMTGNKFGNTAGNCGWWTRDVKVGVTVLGAGQWWQYMPTTTVGETSTTFTIGGDISTGGPSGSAAYSKTYGTPDVTITVTPDSVDESIDWKAALVGCGGYAAYPAYRGASNAAKTSYNLNPSFIIRVPTGRKLKFETSGRLDWSFTVEKDRVKCSPFLCATINVTEHWNTYSKTGTHSCTTTSCS